MRGMNCLKKEILLACERLTKVILFAGLCAYSFLATAQEYPFPQNRTYDYGFMSSQISHTDVQNFYNQWKASYVVDCGSGRYIVDGSPAVVSEGIAYGMLFAAYFGEKEIFDGLWQYYKDHMNANGLMNWCRNGCGGGSCGDNGATDAELDAAMALIIANCQWPGTTSPHNYVSDANTLIDNIKTHEFTTCSGGLIVQKPGDAWGGCTCSNPSYYATGYYRAFADFTGDTWWNQAATDAYTVLEANAHPNSGLVYNWTNENGGSATDCGFAVGGCGSPDNYCYDASRTPWRIAVDHAWWGSSESVTFLQRITNWMNTPATDQGGWYGGGGIANVGDEYTHNGQKVSNWKNSAFTGAFAVAAMASSQADVDNFTDYWINSGDMDDNPYYQNSLRLMYGLLATGNFWYPCSETSCSAPNLGPNQSLCGSTSIILDSGLPADGDRTFEWTRNGSTVAGPNTTSNTLEITQAGTYEVIVDSSGCIRTSQVVVSASLDPDLGPDIHLCSPAYADLDAGISGTGFAYQWEHNSDPMPWVTGQTLTNVRTAGTYRVTVSADGCASGVDEVTITSSLPTPVDACRSNPGTLNLGITNPGLGAGPYEWYSAPSGGSPLTTGTSFTTPSISSNTTYYVQDASSVSGSVGPTTLMGGLENWGVSSGNHLHFTAHTDFTISSLKIPFNVYDNTSGSVTIEILDNSGASLVPVRTFVSDPVNLTAADHQTLVEFSFTGFTIESAWGPDLRMRLTSKGDINGDPLWNQNVGAAYPYESTPAGIATITGKSGGGDAGTYMYFYDWQIGGDAGCDRLPVMAYIGNCGDYGLPVQLIHFTAEKDGNTVHLAWSTATEKNNDRFEVERSYDGATFTKIGSVAGSGTTTEIQHYSFTDQHPGSGQRYYRLRQVDYDGAYEYSPVVSVAAAATDVINVYPNPFSETFHMRVSTQNTVPVHYTLADLTGKEVLSGTFASNETASITKRLPKGVYFLRFSYENRIKTIKIVNK